MAVKINAEGNKLSCSVVISYYVSFTLDLSTCPSNCLCTPLNTPMSTWGGDALFSEGVTGPGINLPTFRLENSQL